MREHRYFVYILTNNSRTFYVGVTNDLERRVWEHKQKQIAGFTARYAIDQLVYFEEFADVSRAIAREKELKGWGRLKKITLIERRNPGWEDLSRDWCGGVVTPKPSAAHGP